MSSAQVVVRNMLEAVIKGDKTGFMNCIHPDVQCIEPSSLPYGGVYKGLESFAKNVYQRMMDKFDIKIEHYELIGSEVKVAVAMDTTFTSKKTGASLTLPYVEIYTVADSKITLLDVYPSDTKKMIDFWNGN
jgi:uncharacterized protein